MKDTPSPYLVTPEMVRAALDEHVQYLVPTSDINTPYHVEVQNALQGIADHINKAVNAQGEAQPCSTWYSDALDVLNPLRWHIIELVEVMESHNRYAHQMGEPLLPVSKIEAAKAANAKADAFFSPNAESCHGRDKT